MQYVDSIKFSNKRGQRGRLYYITKDKGIRHQNNEQSTERKGSKEGGR